MGKRRTQVENKTFEITDCYAGKINKLIDEIAFCIGLCSFLYIYIYCKLKFGLLQKKRDHNSQSTIAKFNEKLEMTFDINMQIS